MNQNITFGVNNVVLPTYLHQNQAGTGTCQVRLNFRSCFHTGFACGYRKGISQLTSPSSVSIVDFEKLNICWVRFRSSYKTNGMACLLN